jgi:Family of unknown function (DUF6256)/Family of unknown function (DUF6186)
MSLASGVGWLVVVALLLTWEGIGLTRNRDGWYTISDLIRVVTATRVGRWLLFAGWLWLGWHLFVRGWRFFLESLPPVRPRPTGPGPAQSAAQLLKDDVGPMLVTFALAVLGVAIWYRTTMVGPRPPGPALLHPRSVRGRLRDVAGTIVGGYLLFLALDLSYYALVAGQSPLFLRQAIAGGTFLAFVAAPLGFAAITALAWAVRRVLRPPD